MSGQTWTLELRAPLPMRSTNALRRMHWSQIAAERRTWRELTHALARKARLPRGLERVRIDAVLRFPDSRRRDAANHYDVLKPCVDALGPERLVKDARQPGGYRRELGYGLIPDDTPAHLEGPYLVIGEPADRRRCPYGLVILTVTILSGGQNEERA